MGTSGVTTTGAGTGVDVATAAAAVAAALPLAGEAYAVVPRVVVRTDGDVDVAGVVE